MSKTESFEFLNELALAFRAAENHPRPQCAPVLEGVRAVLAHLQSAGRLLADDETRLTAEQVEDVRTAREELRGYRNFTGYGRSYVNQLIAAVDALFPATEPAEDAPNLAAVAQEPRRFDPADECQNDNHDPGCVCGAQHWMTAPTPAEPAEEETKAEVHDPDALAKRMALIWHDGWDACGERERGYLRRAAEMAHSHYASSPVVPAPTETGPWQHRDGRICVYAPAVTPRLRYRIGEFNDHGDFVHAGSGRELPEGFAPFVAAAEGS